MPKANYSTILDRKRRWSMCTNGRVGAKWRLIGTDASQDGSIILQEAIDKVDVISMVRTNDAAITNDNLLACEQRALDAERKPNEKFRSMFDILCGSHQACLVARLMLEDIGDLTTLLVRISH